MKIQELSAQEKRVETGVVQFDDDWPGIFIRGDEARCHATILDFVLTALPRDAGPARRALEDFAKFLRSCDVHQMTEVA